jgi:hypothetical protein
VHDGAYAGYRGLDTLTCGQVADHVFHALLRGMAVPAQDAYVTAGISQSRDDALPQDPRAGGDQDR